MVRTFPRGIYPIIDMSRLGDEEIPPFVAALVAGGARIVQLRNKGPDSARFLAMARRLRPLTRRHGVRLVVNDRVDIAVLSEADGVHLGQRDLPIEAARRILGEGRLVGLSTHDEAEAREAERKGADYIGFGPIYPTRTKRDTAPVQGCERLSRIASLVSIPVVAIGGILPERVPEVLGAGAHAAAMISGLLTEGDVARHFRRMTEAALRNRESSEARRCEASPRRGKHLP
ncbi:MAG: thiamine phosphate synthase [Deltaproteobacteria bacterium]|nr:MAG: thiamine phosphate synthase [Deltaproteobacteria bacterium]